MDLFTPTQTYGCHCASCGELWDCYQAPCPLELGLAAMRAHKKCAACGSEKILIVSPSRFGELKQEKMACQE